MKCGRHSHPFFLYHFTLKVMCLCPLGPVANRGPESWMTQLPRKMAAQLWSHKTREDLGPGQDQGLATVETKSKLRLRHGRAGLQACISGRGKGARTRESQAHAPRDRGRIRASLGHWGSSHLPLTGSKRSVGLLGSLWDDNQHTHTGQVWGS